MIDSTEISVHDSHRLEESDFHRLEESPNKDCNMSETIKGETRYETFCALLQYTADHETT
jgi:hypothetical protein